MKIIPETGEQVDVGQEKYDSKMVCGDISDMVA